jgi:hypothetical protein
LDCLICRQLADPLFWAPSNRFMRISGDWRRRGPVILLQCSMVGELVGASAPACAVTMRGIR